MNNWIRFIAARLAVSLPVFPWLVSSYFGYEKFQPVDEQIFLNYRGVAHISKQPPLTIFITSSPKQVLSSMRLTNLSRTFKSPRRQDSRTLASQRVSFQTVLGKLWTHFGQFPEQTSKYFNCKFWFCQLTFYCISQTKPAQQWQNRAIANTFLRTSLPGAMRCLLALL